MQPRDFFPAVLTAGLGILTADEKPPLNGAALVALWVWNLAVITRVERGSLEWNVIGVCCRAAAILGGERERRERERGGFWWRLGGI